MSERSEVKRDGAKAQKNSGRGDYQKGDAKWKKFVVDYKEYAKSIFTSKDNVFFACVTKICNREIDSGAFPLSEFPIADYIFCK